MKEKNTMVGRWICLSCLLLCLLLALLVGCGVEPTDELEPTPTPGLRFLMPTPGTPQASPSRPRTPTPESLRYIVQEGDTLYDIALRYGVEMDDIIEANGITDPNTLRIGQELIIPIKVEPTATPSP